MSGANQHKTEVQRLREQIAAEYEAAQHALYSTSYGSARHEFITAKQLRIAHYHNELAGYVGQAEATRMMSETLDNLSL